MGKKKVKKIKFKFLVVERSGSFLCSMSTLNGGCKPMQGVIHVYKKTSQ
jgi:hypothetical protein